MCAERIRAEENWESRTAAAAENAQSSVLSKNRLVIHSEH
jgi:hypothetical protein